MSKRKRKPAKRQAVHAGVMSADDSVVMPQPSAEHIAAMLLDGRLEVVTSYYAGKRSERSQSRSAEAERIAKTGVPVGVTLGAPIGHVTAFSTDPEKAMSIVYNRLSMAQWLSETVPDEIVGHLFAAFGFDFVSAVAEAMRQQADSDGAS